jgi:cytochrome b
VRPYSPDTVNAEAYAEMRAFRAPIVATHEFTYFVLLVLISIHIAAAVIAEFKEGGAIVSAMFTGRKIHDREPVDIEIANRNARSRDSDGNGRA